MTHIHKSCARHLTGLGFNSLFNVVFQKKKHHFSLYPSPPCVKQLKKNQNLLSFSLQNPSDISLSSSFPSFHWKDRNPSHMNPLKKGPLALCFCHRSHLLRSLSLSLSLTFLLFFFLNDVAFVGIILIFLIFSVWQLCNFRL